MPELPDVETFKRYLDATSLHKPIDSVSVRDRTILDGVSANRLRSTLTGHKLQSTSRHGKYLFVDIDRNGWLVLHFGMTGYVRYFKEADEVRKHDRLLLRFRNGYLLAYNCQRKLGIVSLTDSPDGFIEDRRLGPDALTVNAGDFLEQMRRSRGAIKTAMMNQRLLAGIGNEYSDEILFQARIHPAAKVSTLDDGRLKDVRRAMRRVLKTAIDRQADPERFPRTYLNRRREAGVPCPRCDGTIEKIRAGGRTAYYCPRCQGKDGS